MRRGLVIFLIAALAHLGCGRKKPPLSPSDALQSFQLPPDLRIELVASEPQISDPVAMSFDERGRLYVVEMPDYPLNPNALGHIKLLEDRDGDGRYERTTVFAEGLHFPEGVMPWKKGVLVACAPDILYFEDTDGDGRADVRRVVLTGFAQGNPQLRVNGPQYGIDNWIYVAYPRPPVPRRYVKEFSDPGGPIRFPDHAEIAAPEIHGMDVRFRLDEPKVEAVAGNSQFGHTFDSWGRRFTVWNNDHVRHVVIQNHYLKENPYLAASVAMQSISDHENAAKINPVTVEPHHIHDSQTGHFTSACGLSVYTGGSFPAEYDNNSFTCEPVHNLVHRDVLLPKGATFVARRAYENKEFLASTDSWFRPVFTATGPDGAMYVVDYYRFTVEHPEFVPPQMLKQIDFEARRRMGRIYRIVAKSSKPGPKPNLADASSQDLVASLSNANMWWRITAQRLLIDRRDKAVVPLLETLARQGQPPISRVHALWTLEGLQALDHALVLDAMGDADAGVREHAVRLAEARVSDPKIKQKLLALVDDPESRVEFQVACTLSRLPHSETFQPLEKMARRHQDDPWFQIAVLTSATDNAVGWFRAFLAPTPSKADPGFVRRIASIVGARKQDREVAEVLGAAAKGRSEGDAAWRVAVVNGVADGLRQRSSGRLKLPAGQTALLNILAGSTPEVDKAALRAASAMAIAPSSDLQALVRRAAETARNEKAPTAEREIAIGVLGLDPAGSAESLLASLLDPKEPDSVQAAAAAALTSVPRPSVTPLLIEKWRSATGKVREVILAGLFSDRSRLPAVLDAVQAGTIQPWALGPARTRQLLQHSDPKIRSRAQALLGEASQGDRKAVYEKYLPALTMNGDAARGKKVFDRTCTECHKVGNLGAEVGPDLRTVTKHYKETLLADILIPNQNIESGYEEYLVDTIDGRQISGILAKETPTTLTLRRRKGEEDTILRSSVKALRSLSVSSMPEDIEKSITVPEMADLIAYIKSLK